MLFNGGFTFAERPELEAPESRIIWHAALDPGTLQVTAVPTHADDPDGLAARQFAPWLTIVADETGEHAVLSDGWRHIRIDVEHGSLAAGSPVVLHHRLYGVRSSTPKILPLRRLLDLARRRSFSSMLYPRDPRVDRWLTVLRVHDAMAAGASQREIVSVMFGDDQGDTGDHRRSDSLRSRVRRLAAEARRMAGGGWRRLLRRGGELE